MSKVRSRAAPRSKPKANRRMDDALRFVRDFRLQHGSRKIAPLLPRISTVELLARTLPGAVEKPVTVNRTRR